MIPKDKESILPKTIHNHSFNDVHGARDAHDDGHGAHDVHDALE
jgi:hypothetical protein